MMDMMKQVMGLHVNHRKEAEPQGDGVSRVGGGSHTLKHTYLPPHTPLCGQVGRPTMLHFLDEPKGETRLDLVAYLVKLVGLGIEEYEGFEAKDPNTNFLRGVHPPQGEAYH